MKAPLILDDSDYGFTFLDEKEQKESTYQKLIGLRTLIMPFLKNLMKNPEKDTIKWPNREVTIKQFIDKMDKYILDNS